MPHGRPEETLSHSDREANPRGASLAEATAAALIATSNILVNRVSPHPVGVSIGLASSAGMIALASHAGASSADMGLSANKARRGFIVGAIIALPVAAMMAAGALLPPTQRFFKDDRIVSAHPREAIYELAFRMPLATALGEELTFRSGFESLLARRRSVRAAALVSAVAFGLWHVLPTLDRVHSNPGVADTHRGSVGKQALVVGAVLGATIVGSLGLSWLQRRTGSVVAPIVVHYALNASGFAAGWIASRQQGGLTEEGTTLD